MRGRRKGNKKMGRRNKEVVKEKEREERKNEGKIDPEREVKDREIKRGRGYQGRRERWGNGNERSLIELKTSRI